MTENDNHGNVLHTNKSIEKEVNYEEDTESEYESDDETPPKLKYTRLNKLPPNFFNKDPISTSTFHDEIFIFATHSGLVHICKKDFEPIRTFKAHKASILSVYTNGLYFATGSMDGTVVIGAIYDDKEIVAYDFQRPIHAVVLDPNYSKNKSFISGGMSGKVIYSSKNWLGKRSDIILDQDHGPIVGLEVIDDLVFWMNDKGINVFQISSRSIISVLERPENSPRSDLYWPRFASPDPDRLIISWSNYIWSLRVSIKAKDDNESVSSSSGMSKILPSTASISFRAVQEKKIEIEHVFKMENLICGIASFKDDLWMILTYNPPDIDENGDKVFNNPDLKLINSMSGEVEFEEELGLKNINGLGLNDYNLMCHIETIPQYFIISAKDGVIAEELQLNDRLSWYLDRENYLQAYEISQYLVSPMKRLSFGVQYVDSLVKDDEWKKSAMFLQELLVINQRNENASEPSEDMIFDEVITQWDIWSNIFINSGHVAELTEVIPQTQLLSKEIFNKILLDWMDKDSHEFLNLIKSWDIDIYDTNLIQNKLEQKGDAIDESLEQALVILLNKSLQFKQAVPHLIHLKDENIIQYLSDHHILPNYIEKLPELISLRFDSKDDLTKLPISKIKSKVDDIVSILIDHRMEIVPRKIVDLFNNHHLSYINYFYLEKLNEIDEVLTKGFGDERIQLYCEYDRQNLLPYLKNNNDYDIEKAIEIFEQNDFLEELVYTLGKIGENKKAIELVVNKLNDPTMAIAFAKHQNDKETWELLINLSINKPKFIKALIENSDESSDLYYDPITILQRMPEDIKIEGLNQSIIEFSKNNELNKLINQLILTIIYKQSQETSIEFTNYKTKGLEFELTNELKRMARQFETILLVKSRTEIKLELESMNKKAHENENENKVAYTNLYDKLIHLTRLNSTIVS